MESCPRSSLWTGCFDLLSFQQGLWLAITHRAGQQFRCLWNLCRHVGLWHIFYHPSLATVWQNGLTTNATTSEPFNLGLVILALVWSGHTVFEVNTICLMGLTSFPSWVLVSTRFFNGAFSMHGCESNQQTTGLLPDNSRWKNIRLALIWQELPRIVQLDQKFFFVSLIIEIRRENTPIHRQLHHFSIETHVFGYLPLQKNIYISQKKNNTNTCHPSVLLQSSGNRLKCSPAVPREKWAKVGKPIIWDHTYVAFMNCRERGIQWYICKTLHLNLKLS